MIAGIHVNGQSRDCDFIEANRRCISQCSIVATSGRSPYRGRIRNTRNSCETPEGGRDAPAFALDTRATINDRHLGGAGREERHVRSVPVA